MKYIVILIISAFIGIHHIKAQSSNIECSVYRRAGAYITLTPAHYDSKSLPAVGQKVMLSIYVKDNLPTDKEEGYYELYLIEVIKLVPETKSITFKATSDFEDRKKELGFDKLSLNAESKVKISWDE